MIEMTFVSSPSILALTRLLSRENRRHWLKKAIFFQPVLRIAVGSNVLDRWSVSGNLSRTLEELDSRDKWTVCVAQRSSRSTYQSNKCKKVHGIFVYRPHFFTHIVILNNKTCIKYIFSTHITFISKLLHLL